MRKVIAAFNMTLDGVCDHTTGVPSEDLHQHYADLLDHAGVILYGRTTYRLMQFWQSILQNPSDQKSMNDFAIAIDKIQKLVFSTTLKDTDWESATLANQPLDEQVLALKQQAGKDILIGSRSLIIQLLNHNLVDELQICIHPVVEGKGLLLFDQISDRIMLKLMKTKTLSSGSVIFYYQPIKAANLVTT
jgi:dihydrofolate reductase